MFLATAVSHFVCMPVNIFFIGVGNLSSTVFPILANCLSISILCASIAATNVPRNVSIVEIQSAMVANPWSITGKSAALLHASREVNILDTLLILSLESNESLNSI